MATTDDTVVFRTLPGSPATSKLSEAESKEKHGVWDPMQELTIISPYVHSRVDSNTFAMGGQLYARADLNPMPELTFSPRKGLWIWP